MSPVGAASAVGGDRSSCGGAAPVQNVFLEVQRVASAAVSGSPTPRGSASDVAETAVGGIDSKHLEEVRTLRNPPDVVRRTLEATCLILGCSRQPCRLQPPSWESVQRLMSDADFLTRILSFDAALLRSAPALMTYIAGEYFGAGAEANEGAAIAGGPASSGGSSSSQSPAGSLAPASSSLSASRRLTRAGSAIISAPGIPEALTYRRVQRASAAAGALFLWCASVLLRASDGEGFLYSWPHKGSGAGNARVSTPEAASRVVKRLGAAEVPRIRAESLPEVAAGAATATGGATSTGRVASVGGPAAAGVAAGDASAAPLAEVAGLGASAGSDDNPLRRLRANTTALEEPSAASLSWRSGDAANRAAVATAASRGAAPSFAVPSAAAATAERQTAVASAAGAGSVGYASAAPFGCSWRAGEESKNVKARQSVSGGAYCEALVDFAAGSAEIGERQEATLENVAEAAVLRENLRVQLIGSGVDPDGEAVVAKRIASVQKFLKRNGATVTAMGACNASWVRPKWMAETRDPRWVLCRLDLTHDADLCGHFSGVATTLSPRTRDHAAWLKSNFEITSY